MPHASSAPRVPPPLRFEDFFAGRIKAYGLFQDRFGNVRRHFEVDIEGRMVDGHLEVHERFAYDDGETDERAWLFERIGAQDWTGRADDVVGIAQGREQGNAVAWRYTVMLSLAGRRVGVRFDDLMILHDSATLLGRAKVSKFGIRIGDVFLTFLKEAADTSTAERTPVNVAA